MSEIINNREHQTSNTNKRQSILKQIFKDAVNDESGKYIGTLEFTQNINPIQAIEGEKRIMY